MGKKNKPKKSKAEQEAELDAMFDIPTDEPAAEAEVGYAKLVAEHAAAVEAAKLAPAPPFSIDALALQKGMSLPELGAALESFGLDATGCRKDRAKRLSEKMREMKAAKVAPPPPPEPEPDQAGAAEEEEEEEQEEEEFQDELGKPIDILEEFAGDVDDFKLRLLGKLQLPERVKRERVNAVNRKGQTLLHLAVEMEFEAVILLLLEQGADINARDKQGKTTTQKAIELGAEAALDVLLAASKLDTECYDKNGTTILIGALKTAQWGVAQKILGLGADVLRLDRKKNTALHALCLGAQELDGALPAPVEALTTDLIAKV
eukprot:COSAG06_NODE_21_length_33796_cov_70.184853_13_plen_319_part_00